MRLALYTLVLCGCTQGTTPDCAMVMCGPDLDGTLIDTSADSPSDAAQDATDAGDAGTDVSDAPSDAPKDG